MNAEAQIHAVVPDMPFVRNDGGRAAAGFLAIDIQKSHIQIPSMSKTLGSKNVHVILTVEVYNKLAAEAERRGESMSTLIRLFIARGLKL